MAQHKKLAIGSFCSLHINLSYSIIVQLKFLNTHFRDRFQLHFLKYLTVQAAVVMLYSIKEKKPSGESLDMF